MSKPEAAECWVAPKAPGGGTCYRVALWQSSALPPEAVAEWKQQRAAVLSRMQEAGIRGAKGTLSALEKELKALNLSAIEKPLDFCTRAKHALTRAGALREALRKDSDVLGYRLGEAWMSVWLELSGEEGLEAHISRWAAAAEGVQWSEERITEAMPAAEAAAWQQATRELCAETAETELENGNDNRPFHHATVLATEAVEALLPAPGKTLVDATLGGGGHSERMLQAGASVWGIDQDPAARRAAKRRLAPWAERLHVLAGNFRDAAELLHSHGVDQVDGLLADIGISSPQVDEPERGFSFLTEGPLDMRMNPAAPRNAADIVNTAGEEELADILWQYGEERASRAIARRIVQQREKAPITTTLQLAELISSVLPRKGKQHPATRSFQALRIAVNDELGALEALLKQALGLLRSGGRLAIITFHSLEDRAVKHYFERVTRPEIDRPEWPEPRPNPEYAARLITRKPLTPDEAELAANPRSRSAKLRVIEKL